MAKVVRYLVRQVMEAKGIGDITDAQLNLMGFSRKAFTLLRNNKYNPTMQQVMNLAEWLQVSTDTLVETYETRPSVEEHEGRHV